MQQIVLAQQILTVVVAVGRAHDYMNVLPIGLPRIGRKLSQVSRLLVIELDEQHRAVDAVVVDALVVRSANQANQVLSSCLRTPSILTRA